MRTEASPGVTSALAAAAASPLCAPPRASRRSARPRSPAAAGRRRRTAPRAASPPVALGNVDAGPSGDGRVAEDVTPGRDDRQARPQTIEEPGPKRKPGFRVFAVQADRQVRVAQVVHSLVIRDPALVEEHGPIEEAAILRALPRHPRHRHLWIPWVRVVDASEI